MGQFIASGRIVFSKIYPATLVTNGATVYSNVIETRNWRGFAAMFITLSGASPSVTVTQQCSIDGTNFYDPVDQTGTALGTVCTTLTGTKYIEFTPVISPYTRFKIVAAADSTTTLEFGIQE